jgi:hypothetical protein
MGRVTLIFAALALASGAAQAQIYKCVDAGGKTVYAQSPCPKGAKATTLDRASPPAAPAVSAAAVKGEPAASAAPKTAAELEQAFRKRRQEQGESEKKEADKLAQGREKDENCRSARGQLASLESGTRQARVNEQGERYFLEDEQVEQEKARARRAVESSCN